MKCQNVYVFRALSLESIIARIPICERRMEEGGEDKVKEKNRHFHSRVQKYANSTTGAYK